MFKKNQQRFIGILVSTVLIIFSGVCSGKSQKTGQEGDRMHEIGSMKEFNSIISSFPGRLLVFDLYAVWCAPCRIVAPILEQLALANKDSVSFYRINVEKVPEITKRYNVQGIPYVLFIKNSQVITGLSGQRQPQEYQNVINGNLPTADTVTGNNLDNDAKKGGQPFTLIGSKEAQKLIADVKPFILDVRSENEFQSGHISGATVIPVNQLVDRLGEIAAHQNDTLFVYCFSGHRSLTASKVLSNNGFNHVYSLKGGLMDWRRNGLPLEAASK